MRTTRGTEKIWRRSVPREPRRLPKISLARMCAAWILATLALAPTWAAGPRLLRGHAGQTMGVLEIGNSGDDYQCAIAQKLRSCGVFRGSGRVVTLDHQLDGSITGFTMRVKRDGGTTSVVDVDIRADASTRRERHYLYDWLRPGLNVEVGGTFIEHKSGSISATTIIRSGGRYLDSDAATL
jgi:hypothetical protein